MVNVEPSDRGHSGKRVTDLVRKAIEVILTKPEAPVLLDLADTLAPRPLPRSWTLLLLDLADLREPVASFRYPLSRGLSQQTVGFSRTIFGIRCLSTFRHPSQTRWEQEDVETIQSLNKQPDLRCCKCYKFLQMHVANMAGLWALTMQKLYATKALFQKQGWDACYTNLRTHLHDSKHMCTETMNVYIYIHMWYIYIYMCMHMHAWLCTISTL